MTELDEYLDDYDQQQWIETQVDMLVDAVEESEADPFVKQMIFESRVLLQELVEAALDEYEDEPTDVSVYDENF